jgi:hypothetical protein
MPAPRYNLETTGGMEGAQRALSEVSLDIDSVEGRLDAVETLPYSAAAPADWSGTSPATVKEALDRLAAALGPIP